eukprot:5548526-Amphidinium_carterae.1
MGNILVTRIGSLINLIGGVGGEGQTERKTCYLTSSLALFTLLVHLRMSQAMAARLVHATQ